MRELDLAVAVAGVVSSYNLRNVDYPDTGGQYYFFKLLLLVHDLRGLVAQNGSPLDPEDETLANDRFAGEIIPKIAAIFE
jgi:hypothetical protein